MRCPTCGQDADPANAYCPYCRAALHMPAAPSSPYAGSSPQGWTGQEYTQQPPQWGGGYGQEYPPQQQPGYAQGYAQPPGYGQPQSYVPQQGLEPQPQYYGTAPGGMPPQEPGWAGGYQVLEPGPPPERPGRSMAWLAILIAILVVLAGAGVAIWKLAGSKHLPIAGPSAHPTAGPASSAAGGDGKAQALAIDQLLNASSASRQKLGPALTAVDGCSNVNGAVTTLQQVTAERQNQVAQGQSLAVDQLTNGKQVQTTLVAALTASWQADQKFTAWAQGVAQNGCTGHAPHDDNYNGAQTFSGSATTAKQQFVALWNPIAQTYGLQVRSENTV
jgi:hypothetical protein